MIPLKLCLSNFMSYAAGTPVIDFSGIHIACLSGENGHGKSALLDAMTWALWGQARASSEALIRLGQDTMWVDFEFEVDEVHYRVVRKKTSAGRGATHTELQVVSPDGEYRAQTGQGERSTQDKLNRLLKMDYRTFINSAFILQGRIDEFTRQTATDRKKILAEILDLEQYEKLETNARERQRTAEDRAGILQSEIAALSTEIDRLPEHQIALEQAASAMAVNEAAMTVRDQEIANCRAQLSGLDGQLALLKLLESQEADARRQALEAGTQAERYSKQLQQIEATLNRGPEIVRRLAELTTCRQDLESMDGACSSHLAAQAEETELQDRLRALQHAIELKIAASEQMLRDVRRRSEQKGVVQASMQKLKGEHRPTSELDAALDALRAESEELAEQMQNAASGVEFLQKQTASGVQRRLMLQEPAAACPLCEQSLGPHGHERLIAKFEDEESHIREQMQALEQERSEADEKRKAVIRRAQGVRRQLDGARQAEQTLARLQGELDDACTAEETMPKIELEAAALRQELAGEIDPKIQADLVSVRQRMTLLNYNRARHDALRARARALQPAERDHQALEHARETQINFETQLADARERQRAAEESAGRAAAGRAPMASIPEDKRRLEAVLTLKQQERETLARMIARDREQVGRWNALIDQCKKLEEQRSEKSTSLIAASRDAGIYKDLAAAFSKRGIQAMIIENVIPELENDANRLLSLMTDNGMGVKFRTQRPLVGGGEAETLDIIIGDEMGDRPYECYSGGEAFRVNFAIRMAISRLLAGRAGARLQTVVIDEGFGTQDVNGRKRVLEAIQSIKGEFARILVITHLDDLKDQFPVRFHVVKDGLGSTVSIIS